MKKRILSLIISLCIMLALLPTPVSQSADIPETCTITFLSNGGKGTMNAVNKIKDKWGECEYTLPVCGFTPPTGMHFSGWIADKEVVAGGYYEDAGSLFQTGLHIVFSESITLTAQWGDGEKYNVSFEDSGFGGEGYTDSISVAVGESCALPKNGFNRTGYQFAGWAPTWVELPFIDSYIDNDVIYADQAVITPVSDMTLYPRWREDDTQYTLTISPVSHGTVSLAINYTSEYVSAPESIAVEAGRDVSINVIPDAGYRPEIAYVTSEDNLPVTVRQSNLSTEENENARQYKFTMPACNASFNVFLVSDSSANDIIAQGWCGAEGDGRNVLWKLTKDKTLTISGTGRMQRYSHGFTGFVHQPWNDYLEEISSAVIDDGVTNVSECAFIGGMRYVEGRDVAISEVKIASSVTIIESDAFGELPKLTDIEIPSAVTTIESYAFGRCEKLTTVTIPEATVSIGRAAFAWCESLKDVYYGGTMAQWGKIKIDKYTSYESDSPYFATSGNNPLLNATIHCKDGVIPSPNAASIESASRNQGTITATVTCSDTSATILCAVYSGAGKFISVKTHPITELQSYDFQFGDIQFDHANLFILNENQTPLTTKATVE